MTDSNHRGKSTAVNMSKEFDHVPLKDICKLPLTEGETVLGPLTRAEQQATLNNCTTLTFAITHEAVDSRNLSLQESYPRCTCLGLQFPLLHPAVLHPDFLHKKLSYISFVHLSMTQQLMSLSTQMQHLMDSGHIYTRCFTAESTNQLSIKASLST